MSTKSKRPRKTKAPHRPLELFLDDGFSNAETAAALRAAGFVVHEFTQSFPRADNPAKRQQKITDPPIIQLCHSNSWLLVTTDKDMCVKHCRIIRRYKNVTILATAHNGECFPTEWVEGIKTLKAELEEHTRTTRRPWFMFFSRDGKITATRDRLF